VKIVFMGTSDFALSVLKKLFEKHNIVCVYTKAPKQSGRGQQLLKTPVQLFVEEHNIEVRTPKSLKMLEEQEKFAALNADIAIVAAYGLILPKAVIEAFPLGCVNIHASLLPKWRGAAPIQRCIEAGDKESGITIMNVVEALDAGDILLQQKTPITNETTGGSLHDELAQIGADLILKYLDNVADIIPQKQDESKVCYAAKLDKAESLLDFTIDAEILERKIRAFNPFPATYFEYKGERFKVLTAKICDMTGKCGEIVDADKHLVIACKNGALEIKQIQRQGKKAMSAQELLRGFSFEKGSVI